MFKTSLLMAACAALLTAAGAPAADTIAVQTVPAASQTQLSQSAAAPQSDAVAAQFNYQLPNDLSMQIKSDMTPDQIIALCQKWTRQNGYDYYVQNEMRHLYSDGDRNPRRSAECVEAIMKNAIMDDYQLNIISGWKLEQDPKTALANLTLRAESARRYPNTRAACYLTIGDIYVKQGDKAAAEASFRKVLATRSDKKYHQLANARIAAANR
jgi:hypothetical protein